VLIALGKPHESVLLSFAGESKTALIIRLKGNRKEHSLNINSCQNRVRMLLNGANELGNVGHSSGYQLTANFH